MPSHYTTNTTTSPANTSRSRAPADSNNTVVNGQNYKIGSDTLKIQTTLHSLELKISTSISTNDAALMVLGEYGCGISGEPSNFVLTDDDEETLDNENIMPEDLYNNLKPEQLSTDQSFTDVNDPFYQLDDAKPQTADVQQDAEEAAKTPSYVAMAAAIGRAG